MRRGITAFGGMVAVGFLAGVLGGGWLAAVAGRRAVAGLAAAGAGRWEAIEHDPACPVCRSA